MTAPGLNDPSLARYHRQMLLPDIGAEGQRRLAASHALVIGCGALGTVALDMLARAGVGTLSFVDRDLVELTNLQRQTLYDERHARESVPKALAAAERLATINSQITLNPLVLDVHAGNIEELLLGEPGSGQHRATVGAVIDATDNFQTRYLINDVCVKHAVPWVYGGAIGTRGMQATFLPRTPCLRCVFPEPPPPGSSPTCDTVGVLGPVVGIVACCQAVEALKVLLGRTDLVSKSMLDMDPWRGERRRIDLAQARDPECPCCAHARYEFLNQSRADVSSSGSASLCGQNAVQIAGGVRDASVGVLALVGERLSRVAKIEQNRWFVRARVEQGKYQLTVFADGRTIVQGTPDVALARSLHARYVGA